MELKEMDVLQLEERKNAIALELETEGVDLNALEDEVRSINGELEARKAKAQEEAEVREQIAQNEVKVEIIEERQEEKSMENIEVRNTKEYIDAFAEYVKTGEKRSLLSENATNGTVAVPELVYEVVKHAWDEEGIMKLVKKSYLKGNLKVGFERSATGAVVHTEGVAVDEETLTLGIVNLVPKAIKKWISVSDEALDLSGEYFLRYIYEELAHQIAKKAADELISVIASCTASGSTTSPAVPSISASTIAVGTIATALGKLSDEASQPVVMMNKATWANFKAAQYANNFNVDPFEGLPVLFNNTIKAFSACSTGNTYAIVGDLANGALANFPNGGEIQIKVDDKTSMQYDLVRILGRELVGLGVVAPNHFVKINK